MAQATAPDKKLVRKDPDEKCNAIKADGKGYCGRAAGAGTPHLGIGRCSRHGGSTPLHVKGAELEKRRQEEAKLREVVNSLSLPVDVEPMDALLEELSRTNGVVTWLGSKVASLNEETEAGLGGSEMVGPVGGASGGIPEWKPSVWIAMWEAERSHLAKVAKLCLDAGIDEKRVKLAERQGQMLAGVVTAILTKLDIDLEAPKTRTAIREGFMTIQGEGRELVSSVG
jgi:hypothetical protein